MGIGETIEDYAKAWCTSEEASRRALLERVWAEDGRYVDPNADVRGREALIAHIGHFHGKMPGARVELTSGVSQHHDSIYFSWRLVGADGRTRIDGVDFGQLAEDGRIRRITGFFGPPGA